MELNLTKLLGAKRDRYARAMGDFVLKGDHIRLHGEVSVWDFLVSLNGTMFSVIYMCQDGTIRQMLGRGGVHDSSQDGTVAGIGRPMTDRARLTVSFWTNVYGGQKVNTGAGKGYRTLRAAGVLAIHAKGAHYITDAGVRAIAQAKAKAKVSQ